LDGFPDKRRELNVSYTMGDIGMAAFSVLFMQSPSFLAPQRRFEEGHGRSNCESLFGLSKIPSDNHIRDMPDPASPALLHPVFDAVIEELGRVAGGLDLFRRLGGHTLIALDGTQHHCSKNIHCPHCSTRARGKGETEYYHAMLAAAVVAPGHDKVIPLPPEFITPQDGAEKQDCENRAAKREGLRGQLQCIYFDPPYGIKFNSNFQWSTTSRDVKDDAKDHIAASRNRSGRSAIPGATAFILIWLIGLLRRCPLPPHSIRATISPPTNRCGDRI
jgi:hypothetical protein